MSIPFLKLIGRQVAKVVYNAVGKIPSFYWYFKNFYPSKRVSRNMFMFGHDWNLLGLGYFFGGRYEMHD